MKALPTGNASRATCWPAKVNAQPSNSRVIQREALTRKVVRGLYVSDARLRQPLGPDARRLLRSHRHRLLHRRDLERPRVFRRCLRNVTSMLQPGGTFIIHALHQCQAYKCGDRMFPGSNLSIDDMRDAMLENGFAPTSIDVQVIPCRENAVVRLLRHPHRLGLQGGRPPRK